MSRTHHALQLVSIWTWLWDRAESGGAHTCTNVCKWLSTQHYQCVPGRRLLCPTELTARYPRHEILLVKERLCLKSIYKTTPPPPYSFARAAATRCHRPGSLNTGNWFSHSSETSNPRSRCRWGWFFWGLPPRFADGCPHVVLPSLCLCPTPPSYKDISPFELEPGYDPVWT